MAYNVLKGTVDGSVDQHGDQEIDGNKIFKNTISASVFYDTDAQSPCATMKDVAIKKINAGGTNGLLVWEKEGTARAHYNLTFDGSVMRTNIVEASRFVGSAETLTNIPSNNFVDKIQASSLELGHGLKNIRGRLQVNPGPGLLIENEKVGVATDTSRGITVTNGKLSLDLETVTNIATNGQNLSDNDSLVVADQSRGIITKTTLNNFYNNYLKIKAPQPHGILNAIQLKDNNGFKSSPNFVYDSGSDTLTVKGTVRTTSVNVAGTISCSGAIVGNICNVNERLYAVRDEDYTIVCDTNKNPIDVMLPPACDHKGRILNFKKANSDKYNLRTHPVTLKVQEGTIDRHSELIIKNNYAVRCLQSDGSNWWVIGTHSN